MLTLKKFIDDYPEYINIDKIVKDKFSGITIAGSDNFIKKHLRALELLREIPGKEKFYSKVVESIKDIIQIKQSMEDYSTGGVYVESGLYIENNDVEEEIPIITVANLVHEAVAHVIPFKSGKEFIGTLAEIRGLDSMIETLLILGQHSNSLKLRYNEMSGVIEYYRQLKYDIKNNRNKWFE